MVCACEDRPDLKYFPEISTPIDSIINSTAPLTLEQQLSLFFFSQFIMSIWDKLTGRKSPSSTTSTSDSSHPSSQSNSFQPAPFDPSEAQDVSSFLTGPSFADPSQLHPLAGLNQQTLDYLSLEDSQLSDLPGSQSALPSRGWSDDLCYGTGVTYLTALSLGGAWGLQEGLRRSAAQPPKLRLNSVLNAVTRRGPFLGNSAAVIAMVYNGLNSFIGSMRGKHDSANSIMAGALSGMVFKSTRGVRPMMISGGIVASVAGAWAVSLTLESIKLHLLTKSSAGHTKGTFLSCYSNILLLSSTYFSRRPPTISI
jgi:mitochondrial import inner membrane translocase subunit TIM23